MMSKASGRVKSRFFQLVKKTMTEYNKLVAEIAAIKAEQARRAEEARLKVVVEAADKQRAAKKEKEE